MTQSINADVNLVIQETHQDEDRAVKKTNAQMAGQQKKLIICFLGIFICYFYYGILQEKITKGEYGEGSTAEKFTYTLSLVFVQCIINAAAAKIGLKYLATETDKTPLSLYAICSMTYLGAMLASNHALQHVAYPTQVLGKSVKPIPVMILGVLFARKRYPLAKYFCVLLIVAGVALFMYKDKKSPVKTDVSHNGFIGIGELLLVLSLTLDGLTGASQDKMRSEHQTGAYNMMFHVNVFSILWLAIGLILSGEIFLFLGFLQRHPFVLFNMILFGGASSAGQIFIFITVTTFGPLTCSIITTTRKFFTILASVIIFQNPMLQRQWLGTGLVFLGLGLDSVYGKEKKNR